MSDRLDTLGDLLKLVEDLRDRADQAERLVLRLYIEQGDARIPSSSSAVSHGHVRATVEDLSPAPDPSWQGTATHPFIPPTHTGMMCFDVSADEPDV